METASTLNVSLFFHGYSVICVHPSLAARLSLAFDQPTTCSFGLLSVQAPLVIDPNVAPDTLAVSTSLADRLFLRDVAARTTAAYTNRAFHIGPTVGVLCNPRWNSKQQSFEPSEFVAGLNKLIDAAEDLPVLCYLFRMRDIDFPRQRVFAFLRSGDTWNQLWLPLPDVVYDQVISRRLERQADYLEQREKLSKIYGDKVFNDGFFDKWQVYEWLAQDPRMLPHLPKTIRYTRTEEAAAFAERQSVTFLKPLHGSLGLGIIRIAKLPDGTAVYDMKRQRQPPLKGKAQTAADAIRHLGTRLRTRPYILQQGIDLARVDDRPFDIRIVMQRDETGTWRRTKTFARVAKAGEFTSNLSGGGEALPVPTVLQAVFPGVQTHEKCLQRLRRVARLAVDVMERESGKQFGELGIDIGIDTAGHVWVIEVNSKPWKAPVSERGRADLVDLAFRRPIQYAVWLARR